MDPEAVVTLRHRRKQLARLATSRARGGGVSPVWSGQHGSELTFFLADALLIHELTLEVAIVSPNFVTSPTLVGATGPVDAIQICDGNPRDWTLHGGGTLTFSVEFLSKESLSAPAASPKTILHPVITTATCIPTDRDVRGDRVVSSANPF